MDAEQRFPTWPKWSRLDDRGLARFVTPEAQRWVPLPINRFDVATYPTSGIPAIRLPAYATPMIQLHSA